MVAALRTLKGLAPAGARKGAVLGQMAELGSGSAEAHRSLGREAAGAGLDLLVALGPFAEDVIRGAKEAGLEAASLAADQTEAGRLIREALAEGDWVLVKGSRVAGLEKTVALLSGETDGA